MQRVGPCHLNAPFISHSGYVFPCCRTWNDSSKIICHISDPDIINKMKEFDVDCQCDAAKLQKWGGGKFNVAASNIETSLACNAACAMCCVHAPLWRGKYDLYDDLTSFINTFDPETLLMQGGECLAQPRTLEWLDGLLKSKPNIKIYLVTNGNASEEVYPQVRRIFKHVAISIVGFQDATYKAIMNIDFSNTKKFIKMLTTETSIPISLKFLITPINIHEIGLFMDWAVKQKSNSIQLMDASPLANGVKFGCAIPFWETIIDRAGTELRNSLKIHAPSLSARGCTVYCSSFVVDYLKVTPAFAAEIGLSAYAFK